MDIRTKTNLKKVLYAMRYKLFFLILFFSIAFGSLFYVHKILIEKTHLSGAAMAHSYTIEQEKNFRAYTTALQFAGEELEALITKRNINSFNMSVYDILANLKKLFSESEIVPYAIVNRYAFFLDPEDEKKANSMDNNKVHWFDQVLSANGEIICTTAYKNRLTHEFVVTIAKQINDLDIVIAIDISASDFKDADNEYVLPENSYYYLTDQEGTILYTSNKKADYALLKEFAANVVKNIKKAKDKKISEINSDGEKRTIYYNISSNGWISFISIPDSYLVKDITRIGAGGLIVLIVFLIITIFTTVREVTLNQNIDKYTETIRVLGNHYYAIYRINFIKDTYEMIKDTQLKNKNIPTQGKLDDFIQNVSKYIEDSAKQDFIDSFSAENIKKLVSQRIHDYGGDYKKETADGEYQWVGVRLLFDESLYGDEAVLCFRSLDEEKKAQLQQLDLLKDALENAHQSEQARNMFFSSMSHDMRTPLNAIIGLSDLAQNVINDPQKIADYLNKITISSKHLLDLINDILEISRLEQGKMNVERKEINLKTCIEENILLFQTRAVQEKKNFTVNIDIQDCTVFADPFRINQIMNNLLSNAFKFTKEGSSISVKVKQLGQENFAKYQFEIADTGIGMSRQFMEKLFIPYERETRFGTKNIQGTGLGTTIVKNIISHLGGEIHVKSEEGKGTVFTFTLPFEIVKQKSIKTEQPADEKKQQNILKGKHVLLAEDNNINMEITSELLSMCEMEVTKAWDGQEAFTVFKNSEQGYFDIVLLDMQMPKMDGCEAAKAIRSLNRPDARKVPIIAVTANAFAEDFAATSAAGMDAHISKPIDFSLLCKTIQEQLGKTV